MAGKTIINREISWLAFNQRVLQEAADPTVPLMERIKFLGIFSNNRDEFFRVRVASLKRWMLLKEDIEDTDEDPKEVMAELQKVTMKQQKLYEEIYKNLLDELRTEGIFIVDETNLGPEQQKFITKYYYERVEPVISPIMLEQVKKFPNLRDKGIYLAVILYSKGGKKKQYALVEVPPLLPRFVVLPDIQHKRYVIIQDDIIRYNLQDIFAVFKPEKLEAFTFKFTRDAELDLDNDISKSFMEKMKKSLKERKRGAPVRFVFDERMPKELQKFLAHKMKLVPDEDALIPGGRYHNLKDLMSFPKIGSPRLYYAPLEPHEHPDLASGSSYFDAIREKDILLHHPYQTFNHLIDLLKEAALDPNVRTIRICLYRVAKQSKVVNALINAARNGKKVVVMFELQARFDEENNIYWSNILEDEGAKVFFGFPGLKVHSKICLITRKEAGEKMYYANVSTGNYHEGTACTYGDLSLLTANPEITREVHKVFELFEHAIWPNYRFKNLILSPFYLRNRIVRLINREIKNAKDGKNAFIVLKLNSLVDKNLIQKLYEASKAGVKVRLMVRGICSLVPGIKGLSENIEVASIIDRYLEHARIYVFCNNDAPLYYISSADWMVRNLDRRIEVTCPILDKRLKQEISDILEVQFNDNVKARRLLSNGTYMVPESQGDEKHRAQYELYEYYRRKSEGNG